MSLTTLPLDIILTMITFMDPLDVINLAQTHCKLLHDVGEQNTVWGGIVRQVRERNVAYPFNLLSHSSHTTTLRHEATAPARFFNLLKKSQHDGYVLKPKSHRFVVARPGEQFRTLRLIPGGQILVTASSNGLKLWDLAYAPARLLHAWHLNVYDHL
ncbi:hypothetical protein CVT24_013042 [Panaeolus cyanescens]|uniref:F-box domain-containing protein n=1 Tax=Panaeolus cyanescens TaxID=181874 RepID=A0A409YUP5_9AGAR|nr:hypothetical protein CVT24_013042 [Panaeolus cyanescens]